MRLGHDVHQFVAPTPPAPVHEAEGGEVDHGFPVPPELRRRRHAVDYQSENGHLVPALHLPRHRQLGIPCVEIVFLVK